MPLAACRGVLEQELIDVGQQVGRREPLQCLAAELDQP